MASVSIDVPAGQMARVVAAFCGIYSYQDQVPSQADPAILIANPESKPQFFQRKLREHVKDVVRSWEANSAQNTARDVASAKVDTDITIT